MLAGTRRAPSRRAQTAGQERRVQWALNAQAGALERAADAIIRKTARRVGFRS